ncbi:MAG TPA: hypothetical protein VFQ76_15825, partial [Longimicrobiaceae bacterium]|nr:hypothetical protein [Longimicrobiaceae bacterium]
EESFKHNIPAIATELDRIPLPLVRALFSEAERRRLVDDSVYREQQIRKHKEELVSGKWEASVTLMQAGGLATAAGADALRAAFRLDLEVENAWGEPPGIGGFMLRFLALVQSELDASHAESAALDADPESPYGIGGANGASEEFVGTHTLMSKDGEEKEPLRREALALAKFASAGLATRLLERVRDDPDSARGLDWYGLLRHFVRYPLETSGWEDEVLAAIGQSGEGPVPAPNAVADQPPVAMLTGSRLAQLRAGEGRVFLERSYRDLERTTR